MKKVLTVSLLVVLVLTLATTLVKAATTQADLEKKVLEVLDKVAGGDQYKATVERVFNEYTFTEKQVNDAMVKVEEAGIFMAANGYDPLEYDAGQKEALLGIAQDGAAAVGMKVTVNTSDKTVVLTKGSKTIVAASTETGKLVQTGSDNLVFVVLAGVAIIAVVATVVVRRARANA